MQRRLEEELHLAKHLELVGRLASGTVHDFNNLLTVLMGMAGLAKTEVPHDHPVCQYLNRIEEVGEQASHLTGQLLTFSKQRPHQSGPVDVNTLVEQTLKLAKSIMPPAIVIDMVLDPLAPIVLGDDVPLKQVVMNLCLNARDAMPDGGTLTIRTSPGSPAGENNGKQWVLLSIADTGHGMPAQVRERIFEPFFSTKERGTGLGLAVVQQIIGEFGGKIEVWSEPEKGTRFDIWLVRETAPASRAP
jgi:two-component system cell cycle sensor histidine kinase/response regulator CckA